MKLAEDLRRAVLQAAIEGNLTGGSREGWRFVTIGDVFSLKAGKATNATSIYPEKSEENCYPCFGGNGIRGYKSEFNSEGIHPIIGRQGALCGCLNMAEGKFYATEHAVVVSMLADTNPYFAYYALTAMNLNQYATATAQPGLSVRKILTTPFPLPPLDEQSRIVSRLDAILPLIAELEVAENELEALERRFSGDMMDSLLQAAIEGKLTGGKREGWQWVRLGDVGTFVRGHGIKKSDTTETGKPCIRYGQLYTTFKTSFSAAVSFVPDEIFQKSIKVHKNDILMALTGENNVDIALAVAYVGDEEIAMGGDMTKFTTTIDPMYVVYFMNSPFAISHKSKLATGNIIVHISNDKLASIPFPLPPIEEQHRIVSRLNGFLPLCEALEKIT